MHIDNKATLEQAFANGINLFLGAGFSVLANDTSGRRLPAGEQLSGELAAHFNRPGMEKVLLPQLCTIIESTDRDGLRDYFIDRFSVGPFDKSYYNLRNVNVKTIFTTNIDNLIYKIYDNSTSHYINESLLNGVADRSRTAIEYVPLHGTVSHPDPHLVFSTTDLATAVPTDPSKWAMLTLGLQKTPTLFWGYRLEDASTLYAISSHARRERPTREMWICLREHNPVMEQYFKSLGFFIIIADTAQMLTYLSTLTQPSVVPQGVTTPTRTLFPEYSIPSNANLPVRTLDKFLLGAGPSWYDIYYGELVRSSHYQQIMECVNARKHGIFVGIPASGKTTLMMQVAMAAEFDGHKLVCDSLTTAKARLIVRSLGKDRALVFIDNCSDNIEALNTLTDSRNIQVIGFDRDYDYETASHRVRAYPLVVNISGLDRPDQQRIFEKIPTGLRQQRQMQQVQTQMVGKTLPSVYEVLKANLRGGSLDSRYRQMLQELAYAREALHDYLVMCSYVYHCHSPVSFDMAAAFLHDDTADYRETRELIQIVATLVPEYEGVQADNTQDYFMPRSRIVSDAILNAVTAKDLQRILLKFQRNVSPSIIPDFYIFKRRAYDADLIKRAFPRWEEGKAYYDELLAYDNNFFLQQQAALYFLDRRRYTEAFSYIERARHKAGPAMFSIANSHAIILFEANIRYAGDGDASIRPSLDESMAILSNCYRNDKRKRYHAITFARQAVKYYEVYADGRAEQYLHTAHDWLQEELTDWSSRGLESALRQVMATGVI